MSDDWNDEPEWSTFMDGYWKDRDEDAEERAERWAALKAKRRAEGKCWQCAKLVAECTCPNVSVASAKSAS